MKNTVRKISVVIILISLFLILISGSIFSQKKIELQVYSGGGLSQVLYKFQGETSSVRFGGHSGLAATFFFNKYLGLNIGAEASCYNSKIFADGIKAYSNDRTDDYYLTSGFSSSNSYVYNLTSTLYNYTEEIQAVTINIPIGLQFQTTNKKYNYYFIAGMKIGIPINSISKYNVADAEIYNFAYYPEINNTVGYEPDNAAATTNHFSGFGYFPDKKFESNLDLKVSFVPSFETGCKFSFSKPINLYLGAYCDFGISDIRNEKNQDFIPQSNGQLIGNDFVPNSLLVSNQTNDKAFVDKAVLFSAGIKLRLSFGVGNDDSQKIEKPEIIDDNSFTHNANRIKGYVKDSITQKPLEAEVQLINVKTDELYCKQMTNKKTGEFVFDNLPNDMPFRILVKVKDDNSISRVVTSEDILVEKIIYNPIIEQETEKPDDIHSDSLPADFSRSIKGFVNDSLTKEPLNAEIQIVSPKGDINKIVKTNAETGEFIFDSLPFNMPFKLIIKVKNHYPISKDLPIETVRDTVIVEKIVYDSPPVVEGTSDVLKDIYFGFEETTISPENYAEIDKVYELMKKYPKMIIEVSGHADSTGGVEYNLDLSKARADAVAYELIKKGISKDRILEVGYGFYKPSVSNDTKINRRKNRRVEIRILSI